MNNKENYNRGQSVQFLFTMLLLFFLAISALFTILFGAKLYENIGNRMEENFTGTTALAYVSNKVRQGDKEGQISVQNMENTDVLRVSEVYGDTTYYTLIYCKDGSLKELFYNPDSGLTLSDGIDIMDLEYMSFEMLENNLLKVENADSRTGEVNSLTLSLRSEVNQYE